MNRRSHSGVTSEEAWSEVSSHLPVRSRKAASLNDAHPCAVAASAASERCRSLHGVGGERNDLPLPVEHDQDAGMRVERTSLSTGGYGLRRTFATTALHRFAQRSPARTCLAITSVVLVVGAVLAIVSAGLLARNAARSNNVRRPLKIQDTEPLRGARCGDDACRRMGSLLQDSLDESVHPCDNFHAYVCGSWRQTHPGQSIAQSLAAAFIDNVTRRAKLVHIPFNTASKKQTAVQKAARHLVACDDIVAASDDQSADVRKVLVEGGIRWPYGAEENASSADVLERILYMSQIVKIPVLLTVTVERAAGQRIVIKRPDNIATVLAESRRSVSSMTFEKYEEYFRAVYDSFSNSDDQWNLVDRFNKIRRLESVSIAFLNASELHSDSRRKVAWHTNIASFQRMTPSVSKDRWLEVFQKFLNITTSDSYPVVVRGRRYIQTVFALHKELGETDFTELYDWLCVRALFPFTNARIIAAERPGSEVLESHRALCFAISDRFFHYALQYPYLSDVVTTEVREDIGSLMQAIGLSLARVLSRVKSSQLNINCTSDVVSRASEAYTRLFRRSSPEHFEEAYARYPDMNLSAVDNWISSTSSTFDLNVDHHGLRSFADGVRKDLSHVWSEPLEASYLDSPWYSLSAPNVINLAGIGSRLVWKLISHLVLKREVCKTALAAKTEDMWHCVAATLEGHFREAGVKKGLRAAMLYWAVLWEAYSGQTQYRGKKVRVLDDYPHLSEQALLFVFGCLWSCGEGVAVAEAYCNLPLRHDVNFATIFSCPRGSPMRPEVQCPSAFTAGTVDSS